MMAVSEHQKSFANRLKPFADRVRSFARRGKWLLLGGGIGACCAGLLAGALLLLYNGGAKATALSLSGDAVYGEMVVMAVTVENGGWFRANYHARLTADGGDACARDIVLEPKERRTLAMDVSGLAPGGHTMAIEGIEADIRVLRPAKFEVSGFTVSPGVILPGGSVIVSARVFNSGEMPGVYDARFMLDGRRAAGDKVAVGPGESRTVSATLESVPRGSHEAALGGAKETFAALAPANLVITDLMLSSPYANPKKEAAATVFVTNSGDYPGTFTAELFFNGKSLGKQEVSVDANSTGSCAYKFSSAKEGKYKVKAGDIEQTFEVVKLSRPKTGTMLNKKANGGYCTLRISNQCGMDVIVTLASKSAPGTAVLSYYLRAGEKNKAIKVKNGNYYVYYMTGRDYAAKYKKFMYVSGYKSAGSIECTTYKTYSTEYYWEYDWDWHFSYKVPYTVTTTHYYTYDFPIYSSDYTILVSDYPK